MAKKRKGASFFKEFLKERKTVGSIAPSSRYLSRRMIAKVDFSEAKAIVELGPGTGPITKEIVKRLNPDTQLLIFEMNSEFVEKFLQFDQPNIHVINDSAEHIGKYMEKYGIEKVDYIISSLPLTNFPPELKERILDESIRSLKTGGVYMQYQYMTTAFKLLKSKFQKVRLQYAPFNIPPAFVYTCYT